MQKIKLSLIIIFLSSILLGCQTVKEKTDIIVKKENEKLSKYIGKSLNDLKLDLGNSDEDYRNDKGNMELVYKTKKYGIPCERKFEVNSSGTIVAFSSSGCI